MNCDHFTILKFRVYTILSMIHQCKILGLIIQNVFLENLSSNLKSPFETFRVILIRCILPPVEVSNDFKLNLKRFHQFTITIFEFYTIYTETHQCNILGLIICMNFQNISFRTWNLHLKLAGSFRISENYLQLKFQMS